MLSNVVGIQSINSNNYIAIAFQELNDNNTLLGIKTGEKCAADGPNLIRVHSPKRIFGWYEGPQLQQLSSDQPAQLLYTSGTTGKPKIIVISQKALSNTVDRLNKVMQVDASIREYIGIPVNFSFGFGRCRAVSAVGGKFFLPEHGFNPSEIVSMLERDEINAISAVPTLWRTIIEEPSLFEEAGKRVKWIEIGSQYMSSDEKISMRKIFPNARIVQHYGMTEASRSTFLCLNDVGEEFFESVGQALDGVEIKVSDGGIFIKGDHIALGQLKNETILPLTDEEGWLDSKDLGQINNDFLYYNGRSDDQINMGGVKISPDQAESYIRTELAMASPFACFKEDDDFLGERLAIAIEESEETPDALVKKCLANYLASLGVSSSNRVNIYRTSKLPRTDTGKIKRKELKSQLSTMHTSQELKNNTPTTTTVHSNAQTISNLWSEVLGIPSIPIEESFFDLGGDSISAIRLIAKMERSGIPKNVSKRIFEGATIKELGEMLGSNANPDGAAPTITSRTKASMANLSINVIRGFLVLMNIASHWMPGVIERLPKAVAEVNRYFAPLYSSGTPGFAIIFGCGVGFYLVPRYQRSPYSVTTLALRNALFLGAGILLTVLVFAVKNYLENDSITIKQIIGSFYSILFFYFLAMLSLPLWLKLLTSLKNRVTQLCVGSSIVCYSIHLIIDYLQIAPSQNPAIQLSILMLTAKYNYPEMMSGVLLGIGSGNWLKENIENKANNSFVGILGVFLICFSIILSIELNQAKYWFIWPKGLTIWSWTFYLGCCLLMYACMFYYLQSIKQEKGITFWSAKLLSTIGVLAFPFLVAHQIVLPLIATLRSVGVPFATGIVLILFFSLTGWMSLRVFRLYFGAPLGSVST